MLHILWMLPHFFDIRYLFVVLQTLDLDKLGKGVKPGLSRSDACGLDLKLWVGLWVGNF